MTEQLTKCCEPLLKLWVRLGSCKTSLSPPVILYCWSFQSDSPDCFMFLVLNFCAVCTLCAFSYFLLSLGDLGRRLLGNSCSLGS